MSTVEFVWLKHFAPVQFDSNLFVVLQLGLMVPGEQSTQHQLVPI